jgi:hypothetical protein
MKKLKGIDKHVSGKMIKGSYHCTIKTNEKKKKK